VPAPTFSHALTPAQISVVEQPLSAKIFLEGPAGCGKTTAGVERLLYLMAQGVPGSSILLIAPQRTLTAPYAAALKHPGVTAGGLVTVLTVGGLAQRMLDLFWPVVGVKAGFANPDQPPVFLTLETAQYYMAHLVRPLLDERLFESVVIERNRLYSQVIDNLNKAAVVGFPYGEIGERLKASTSDPGQAHIYEDVQSCASLFRAYCLAHNLLDFSLQVEVFMQHLWPDPLCREYLLNTYRHLIVDNLEEDTVVAHDLLRAWLPESDSALLIYDAEAGFRNFLGADPLSAHALKDLCDGAAILDESFVTSATIQVLGERLGEVLSPTSLPQSDKEHRSGLEAGVRASLAFEQHRFYPQMLDWTAEQIATLVFEDGVRPEQIAVLAPYLSDALRYSLTERLEQLEVPVRSHRPSRSLREEPASQCLLTLAGLAHPDWGFKPTKFDVAYMLVQAIQSLDLVRAQLLAEIVFRIKDGAPVLSSFDQIKAETQQRITYRLGQRYEVLREWLERYRAAPPEELDYFLSRLFGEVLSQPGYGFHANFNAGEVAANLIESVQKFRWAARQALMEEGQPLGKEYLAMVQDGVIAAQYIRSWQAVVEEEEAYFESAASGGAVLLAPAYTFLMRNRPVEVQFWLNVGSRGWVERLYQPLTHPYVLSRAWPAGRPWTDSDEVATSQAALYRLALGLVRRCRQKIYLGLSELSEQGFEERGQLLRAFQRILREATG